VSLLIRREGEVGWHAPEVSRFKDEALLQEIIVNSPSLLPGVPETGVLAVAEVDFIDVLCLDLDGGITICECKLHTNPEIKRKIVGQLIAYAAALWRMPYDEFDRRVAARAGEEVITRMQQLATEAGASDLNSETFRAAVTDNLQEGRFRLVFAVDHITEELKGIVEFVNAHTSGDLQVLAVEIGYVRDSGVEILDPAVYGSELAEGKGGAGRPVWDRASFIAALRARSPGAAPRVEAVMAWAEQGGADGVYGSGNDGSWYPVWNGKGMKEAPISGWTSGSVCVNMHYFRRVEGFEEAAFKSELAHRCEKAGVALSSAKDSPTIECPPLADGERLERFFSVLDWVRERFYAAPGGSSPSAI
jgi:hypothetical protein